MLDLVRDTCQRRPPWQKVRIADEPLTAGPSKNLQTPVVARLRNVRVAEAAVPAQAVGEMTHSCSLFIWMLGWAWRAAEHV